MLLASILIFIEDGFPIFFKQRRIGKNKEIFTIYKIRTMKNNTPELGTHQINKNFLLKVGRFIRAIKLDEFPQLVNVIKGEINLVGPRPGLENQYLLKEERDKRSIFDVKPGITGLSQILGYDMSNPQKLAEIDMNYIEKRTNYLNFLILLGTFFPLIKNYLVNKIGVSKNLKVIKNV
tara:strand:+ start:5390 stop:5923 length:534 start_codon:yes stop_codon:yes gene_type:complete